MSKENITTAQMRAELAGARFTADSIALRLKGKLMGTDSLRRAELQRLAQWGIEANHLTPVVVDKVHGLLEQLSVNISTVTPQDLELVRESIPVAVAEETAEVGSGRLFLYDTLREYPRLQKVAGILLTIFMLTGCLALPDSAHAATATPGNAATLDLDDADTLQPTQTSVLTPPTATKTPRATTTLTPRATPTERPTPTATPERLDVQRVRTEFTLKVIPAGINIRTSPNGEIAYNTKGEIKLEITGKTEKAGNYTWIQVKDGDDLLWVADLSRIIEETTSVETYVVGGEISDTELLREAQRALGASEAVVGVYFPTANSFPFAFRADGTVVAVRVNGEWQKTIITGIESVADEQENTEDAVDRLGGAEVTKTVSFAEFSEMRPDLLSKEKIGNGILLHATVEDNKGVLKEIDITELDVQIMSDGTYNIVDQNGDVLYTNLDTDNVDESLNDWLQPLYESDNGLFKLWLSKDYNDPNENTRLPNQEFTYLWGFFEAAPQLIDIDLTSVGMFKNPESYVIDYYKDVGYLAPDAEPSTQPVDASAQLELILNKFFGLLKGARPSEDSKITILMQEGTEATIDASLGVNFVVHNTPKGNWLQDGAKSSIHVTSLPEQAYTVNETGQLTIYVTTNKETSTDRFYNGYITRALDYILAKNDMPGDRDAGDSFDILEHTDLYMTGINWIRANGNTYFFPPLLLAQSANVGETITYNRIR